MGNTKSIPEDKKEEVKEVVAVKEVKAEDEYNIAIVADYDGKIDPFYISNKDPNYEYRFLYSNQTNLSIKTNNMLLQKGGWQICSKEHCLRIGVKEEQIGSDGYYHAGDTVLAFMPKHLHEKKEKYKQTQANEPVDAVQRLLKEGDNSPDISGASVGHESMKGIQTKKQMGLN